MSALYENCITKDQILFKHARGKSATKALEMHPYHEILYFVNGTVDLVSEHTRIALEPDTLVMIPKEIFHQFAIKNPNSYERYVFNFPPLPEYDRLIAPFMKQITVVRTPGRRIQTLFERLARAYYEDYSTYEKETFVVAILLQLLLEIKQMSHEFAVPESRSLDSVLSHALQYIRLHYLTQISIEEIATQVGVSKSQLSHTFQRELHIPVYRFITEKRLIHANKLIADRVPPTEAATSCGFNDYSSFYKAYRKFFGFAPSRQP